MSAALPPLPVDDLDHVLAHTGQLWAGARGAAFFITGGTGFFGTWLLESFARANDTLGLGMRAVVLTRDPAAFAAKAPHLAARADLQFHQGDLSDFVFPAGHFAYFVHSAADTAVWTRDKGVDGTIEFAVASTRRVLDFAAQAGVTNVLLVGSGAVYGPQPADLKNLPEDYTGAPDPLLPESAWGEGKRVTEHLFMQHALRHGYSLKIARCFSFVGPHLRLDAHYAIGNFIRDVRGGGPIRVSGDGTPVRSYLYAADLAVWLWTLLFSPPGCRAYNVGSDEEWTIGDVARCVSEAAGGGRAVEIARPPEPGRAPHRYIPALDRARRELGLAVRIPLPEGIRRTQVWLGQAGDFSSQ